MNVLDKQSYFAFLDKWFRINPESIVAFEQEQEEVVLESKEIE